MRVGKNPAKPRPPIFNPNGGPDKLMDNLGGRKVSKAKSKAKGTGRKKSRKA